MSAALLLAVALFAPAATAAVPQLLSVRMGETQDRPAVQLVSSAPLGEVGFARDGAQIVLSFVAAAPDPLPQLIVAPPVQSARLVRRGERLELRLTVSGDTPYFMRREEGLLQLVFDTPRAAVRAGAPPVSSAPPAAAAPPRENKPVPLAPPPAPVAAPAPAATPAPAAAPPAAPRDVPSLYGRLFPAPGAGTTPEPPPPDASASSASAAEHDGLALGRAVLRPSVDLLYVDGSGTVLADEAVNEDSYVEIRPRLRADLPLGNGALDADYEARLRAAASLPEVRHATHLVNASLNYPLGQLVTVRAREHYARGTLEATEVDPGREYFFRLARFRRNSITASLQVETAARLKIDLSGTLNTVNLDQGAGFFDYEQRSGQAGLLYELSPTLSAAVAYFRVRVPASAERALAETEGEGVQATLQGTLTPLLTAQVGVGYTSQESPQAAEAGRGFRGLTADARLTQELGRATTVSVGAQRSTQLSAFEDNAFYVTSGLRAEANVAGPFELVLRGGGGVRWNDYRLPASTLGVPRADRIVDWGVGAGRSIGRRAFLRADYTRERRHSNLDAFRTTNWSFVAQLGLGWLDTAGRP